MNKLILALIILWLILRSYNNRVPTAHVCLLGGASQPINKAFSQTVVETIVPHLNRIIPYDGVISSGILSGVVLDVLIPLMEGSHRKLIVYTATSVDIINKQLVAARQDKRLKGIWDRITVVSLRTLDERQRALVSSSPHAYVLPGGNGTMYELFELTTKVSLRLVKNPRSIFIVNTNGYYDGVKAFMTEARSQGLITATDAHMGLHWLDLKR